MDLSALSEAHDRAREFLAALDARAIVPSATADELRAALGGPLPSEGTDAVKVIDSLARAAAPGLLATPSARFFGFVIGGSLPAAVAADWLTSAWDQNAGLSVTSPAASVVEEIAGGWLRELFGLPAGASFGLVTGGMMANFTGLAAARTHVLRAAGVDVEVTGLHGAPRVRVVVGAERHVTIDVALRFLGFGTNDVVTVEADEQGRMRADALRAALRDVPDDEPVIVCAQAGNVNSGAFDPIGEICDVAHERGAWVHVDGAFGLWAAAVPSLRHLIDGLERADSWATDAHKWLNVPYDCGLVFCAHPASHRVAMTTAASYLMPSETERDELDWVPEFSRRARGFTVYAALRALGRAGVVEMVERACACARRFSERLGAEPGVEIRNEVVLNQVLVRFGDDDQTRRIIAGIQADGTCWMGGTTWHGDALMRISVSNWQTTLEDVDRSVDAILRVRRALA